MSKCISCGQNGKTRKYFLPGEELCGEDSSDFLEILIDDLVDEVTIEAMTSAYERFKIKRDLKATQIKSVLKPEPNTSGNPFKTGI